MTIEPFPDSAPASLFSGGETPVAYFLNADARTGAAANGKASFTIDQAADQIVRSGPGWSAALGQPFSITYGFRDTAPTTYPDDVDGFSHFNSAQIVQAELSLAAWSDVANITFVRVGSGTSGPGAYSDQAAILFANYDSGVEGAAAFASFPGSTRASARAGDVWVNITFGYNANPVVGGYGAMVLTHELGHAIGLDHPSDYDAGPDASPTYAADASYYEDSRQYTVMSYFSETNTGGAFGGVYSAAPLLDDIAAAQLEYGANMTTRTGDTVYGFNSTAGRPWYAAASSSSRVVFAVWDAGGVDTLDFSGFNATQTIDLRAGFFSSVGGLSGNVAIAQHADVENARGGFGPDTVFGNDLDNTVSGGAGDDSIAGGAGANYLRGDDGNDQILGGANFDDMNGNVGDDTAAGGDGTDWVVGGKNNDLLAGDAGDDIVYGNLGADTCDGGVGNDLIRGGQENDSLIGGGGSDWLSGDRGDDTISGGAGADTFHSFSGAGIDRILDFSLAEGDRVQLDLGTAYSVRQSGFDTIIDLGGGDAVVLLGVALAGTPTSGWIFEA